MWVAVNSMHQKTTKLVSATGRVDMYLVNEFPSVGRRIGVLNVPWNSAGQFFLGVFTLIIVSTGRHGYFVPAVSGTLPYRGLATYIRLPIVMNHETFTRVIDVCQWISVSSVLVDSTSVR